MMRTAGVVPRKNVSVEYAAPFGAIASIQFWNVASRRAMLGALAT